MAALMVGLSVDAILGGLRSPRFESGRFLIVYPITTFVFLVPAIYLHRFARRITRFVAQGHMIQLEAALEAQRKFWQFTGMMVLLTFVVLTLVAGLAMM